MRKEKNFIAVQFAKRNESFISPSADIEYRFYKKYILMVTLPLILAKR
jgi:hypothetical protein